MTNRIAGISALLLYASLSYGAQPVTQDPGQLQLTPEAFQRALTAGQLKFRTGGQGGAAAPHSEPQALPHWTGSFRATTGANRTADTLTYSYTMVGTDPAKGSATTTIRTILVPLRLQFEAAYDTNLIAIPGGAVLDASTDIAPPLNTSVVNNVLRSPQFTPSPVYSGAVNLGNTQYADGVQRANLWNIVSVKAPDYHVLLKPEMYATQTIVVPAGSGYAISFDGSSFGSIFEDQLSSNGSGIADIVANVTAQIQDPSALVVVLSHNSDVCNAGGCALGYHVAQFVAGAPETTYIFAGYFDGDDIHPLSHEVSEWINDPFIDNLVPAWPFVGNPSPPCSNTGILEVGDPLEFLGSATLNYPVGGITWHPQDIVFLPWFEGAVPSTSVNGWYTFANSTSASPEPCQGSYDYLAATLDFPGADWTHAFGVNNQKTIVGDYHVGADSHGRGGTYHGFIYQNGVFTRLDVPGASLTEARGINDAGQVAGVFDDSNGNEHGFLYNQGSFQVIDSPDPNAAFTDALGINNSGVIVGEYADANFVGHSFQWSDGKFTVFNPTFSAESAADAISNSGTIVGSYDTDLSTTNNAYFGSPSSLAPFMLPRALPGTESATAPWGVNSRGDVAGWFCNAGDCSFSQVKGFVWSGITHTWANVEAPNAGQTQLFGINDNGVVVGYYRVVGPHKGHEHAVVLTPAGH